VFGRIPRNGPVDAPDTPNMASSHSEPCTNEVSLSALEPCADATDGSWEQVRGGAPSQSSRALELESIKNDIQKLTQMQQALSNIVRSMHQQAMAAIRHLR